MRDITADPDDAATVTAIVAMAHRLGLLVMAEWVETAAARVPEGAQTQ